MEEGFVYLTLVCAEDVSDRTLIGCAACPLRPRPTIIFQPHLTLRLLVQSITQMPRGYGSDLLFNILSIEQLVGIFTDLLLKQVDILPLSLPQSKSDENSSTYPLCTEQNTIIKVHV